MADDRDEYAAFYYDRWRGLTEQERRAMHNLRTIEFMDEALADFLKLKGTTMPRTKTPAEEAEVWLDEHDRVTIAVKRVGWDMERDDLIYRRDKLARLGDAATPKQRRKLAAVEKSLAEPQPDWEEIVLEEKRLNPPTSARTALPLTAKTRREADEAVRKLSMELERQFPREVANINYNKRKAQPK